MNRGNRRGGERPAAFARAQLCVDPALVEEALRDLGHARREVAVGARHDLARLCEAALPVGAAERRIAVVVGERGQPEQARLEAVVARHEVVAADTRVEQRIDALAARLVGEVTRGHRVRIAAPAIVGGLVLDQDVEDESEHARVRAQPGRQPGRPGAARLAVGVVEQRERLLLGELLHLAADRHLELEVGHDLVEQAAPRGAARVVGLGEHALLGLRQHVLAVAAHSGEVVAATRELGLGEQCLRALAVGGQPLELEEEQCVADLGAALLHVLEQCAVTRRLRVRREQETRERARARGGLRDRFDLVDRARELCGAERRDPAAIALRERGGGREHTREVLLDLRVVGARVEMREIPADARRRAARCRF